ncbi:hypothetical protein N9C06_01970 [Salibacteraceae bacterium]|jgi:hypothetical protein|nr:hypothetical protein [Salibacteraceae bacterium]
MKRTQLLTALIAGVLSFSSCSSDNSSAKSESKAEAVESPSSVPEAKEVQEEETQDQTLVLNEGLRWEANIETTTGVSTMLEMVINEEGRSAKDLAILQEKLNTEFKGIFEKCNMKGESHIQLHNFLLPLKTAMNGLSAEAEEDRVKSLDELKTQLSLYSDFFE